MAGLHVAAVPIGRIDVEEIEAALGRAAKVLHQPLELREPLPVPRESEDGERGQHRAAVLLNRLGMEVLKLKPGRVVGGGDAEAKPPFQPDGFVFITDVDLFTAKSDGVVAALLPAKRCAVVSVRRLREAYFRRKADPVRQRARLVKEVLRMSGRLAGLGECNDSACVLAPSRGIPDIDAKEERFCRACEQRLFEGRVQI